MGHNNDAAFHGTLEGAFKNSWVHWNNCKRIDALGNEILNDLELLCCVRCCRAALCCNYIRICLLIGFNTGVHAVEPRNTADLDDSCDNWLFLCDERTRAARDDCCANDSAGEQFFRY